MMVPGMLTEQAYYKITGKVGGVIGWFWTMIWLLLWRNVIIDGFARAGMYRHSRVIEGQSPVRGIVENLVINLIPGYIPFELIRMVYKGHLSYHVQVE